MPVSPTMSHDELLELLATPQPRPVPRGLRREVRRRAWPMVIVLCILFLATFGTWQAMKSFPCGFWHDWQLAIASASPAGGRVTAVTDLHQYTRNSSNSTYAYDFVFTPAGGGETHGVSYEVGPRYAFVPHWPVGARVDIEYLASDPTVARIAGSRTTKTGLFEAGGLIYPVMALGLFWLGFWNQRRQLRLLEHGTLGEVTVESVEQPRPARGNRPTMFKITLRPTGANGEEPLVLRNYVPAEVKFFSSRLVARQPVYVLFDPARPKRVIYPETLLLK